MAVDDGNWEGKDCTGSPGSLVESVRARLDMIEEWRETLLFGRGVDRESKLNRTARFTINDASTLTASRVFRLRNMFAIFDCDIEPRLNDMNLNLQLPSVRRLIGVISCV